MARGDAGQRIHPAAKRNPLLRSIQKKEEGTEAKREENHLASHSTREEISLYGAPLRSKTKLYGESLETIHRFSEGSIPPEEVLRALATGFVSELDSSGKLLSWKEPNKSVADKSHRQTPSHYTLCQDNRGGQKNSWIQKEWYQEGELSRLPSLGPAVVVINEKGLGAEKTHEWWFDGDFVGSYSKENGYTDAKGEQLEGPSPHDNTPWPGQMVEANIASHAESEEEEIILQETLALESNPFLINPNPNIEEDLIRKAARDNRGLKREAIDNAIESLVDRKILQRKRRGSFLRGEKSSTLAIAEAVGISPGNPSVLEDKASISREILENLQDLWQKLP